MHTASGVRPVVFFSRACFALMLLASMLLLPALSQADGLFDFQMKLAKKGNAEAQFKVGEMYETGFGVKQNEDEAMKWISKAAAKGHETAGFKLLYWDLQKNGVTDGNKARLDELKAKADAGNPQAQFYVGKMYAHGVGEKKNNKKALEWLNKAALVGVLAAEPEIVYVRETKQRQALAKRRADEKKRAQQKARQEAERQKKLEAQRKLQAQKQAEAKAKAEALRKKQQEEAAAAAALSAEKQKASREAAEKARLKAQQEAEARRLEARKQALLRKREAEERQRKAQFESDPCSGKSARFLSTCR